MESVVLERGLNPAGFAEGTTWLAVLLPARKVGVGEVAA